MKLRIKNRTEELKDFIMKGTSPFHVTAEVARKLKEGGYEELNFHCPWQLERGGRYYVMHRDSTLIAFSVGEDWDGQNDFRMAAAHTDFPNLPDQAECRDAKRRLRSSECGSLRRGHLKYMA